MPPEKKNQKIAPPPRKLPPGKLPSRKLPPREMPPKKIALPPGKMPPKNCFTSFSLLLTLSYSCSFLSIFIVTSFRGVSGTPATSIMDLLVTLVNGIK